MTFDTAAAFHERLDEITAVERTLQAGPNIPLDDQTVLEGGYKSRPTTDVVPVDGA